MRLYLQPLRTDDMDDDSALLATLEDAIADLLWMSEADYPFEVCHWSGSAIETLTPATLLEVIEQPPDSPIETVNLDAFFEFATQDQDWHGPTEQATVQRYRELVALLKSHLLDLAVYRVGEIAIDLYILGRTATGSVAGLKTRAVET